MSAPERLLKRAFDAVWAAVCLVLFSPLLVVCWLMVWLDKGGRGEPVIFSQERIGLGGRPFRIYKFRTMSPNAEAGGPQLFDQQHDPRLTRQGRRLRAHHLDELPQLWNVLRGDMSFVGPRPERAYYIKQIMQHDPRYEALYQLRPGVTSMATLRNGYTDTMEKMLRRLELDLHYLTHRTLLTDARILLLTFWSIVRGSRF